ncbi:hypothetical protein LCGC14_3151210 [marine sediment metagenome]|uniref:Uncharacterized protein n=1 Tax=marine sediment metagenome TaxID=412755 RepID=A0A0F8WI25_9ZZZZ
MAEIDKKRAEIRAIVDNYVDDGCSFPKKRCSFYRGGYCASNNESYKCLTERLGIVGVVIKVDRELNWWRKTRLYRTLRIIGAIPAKTGESDYVAVESLIGDKSADIRI